MRFSKGVSTSFLLVLTLTGGLVVVSCSKSDQAATSGPGTSTTSAAPGTSASPGTTDSPGTTAKRSTGTTTKKSSGTTKKSTGGGDEEAICEALDKVAKLDKESSKMSASGSFEDLMEFLQESVPEFEAAYAEAAEAAEGELRDNIEKLSSASIELTKLMAEATSMDEIQTIVKENGTLVTDAAAAAVEVDAFTTASCGFSINN